MKYLYKTLNGITTGSKTYYVEVRTDGVHLYFTIYNSNHTADYSSANVTYNDETESFFISTSGESTISFDYDDSVKELSFYFGGLLRTVSWRGSFSDPDPEVSVVHTGIRAGDIFSCNFTFSGAARNCRLVEAYIYRDDMGRNKQYHSTSLSETSSFSYRYPADSYTGVLYRTELTFACYRNASDTRDKCIGLYKYVLPDMMLTYSGTPYTPWSLCYSPEVAGAPTEITWADINDSMFPDSEYVLSRYTDKRGYELIYRGRNSSYIDRIPGGATQVAYTIYSESGYETSAELTGETLELQSSNVFIGINGAPTPASAVYIGQNGSPVMAGSTVFVGK